MGLLVEVEGCEFVCVHTCVYNYTHSHKLLWLGEKKMRAKVRRNKEIKD